MPYAPHHYVLLGQGGTNVVSCPGSLPPQTAFVHLQLSRTAFILGQHVFHSLTGEAALEQHSQANNGDGRI